MTSPDYLSIVIIAACAVAGLLGALRWLGRCAFGLAVGCAILIALSGAGDTWGIGSLSEFINRGHIAPALSHEARTAAERLRWNVPPPEAATQKSPRGDANIPAVANLSANN